MYERNGEIKSLVQWVKKMKQFDLQIGRASCRERV